MMLMMSNGGGGDGAGDGKGNGGGRKRDHQQQVEQKQEEDHEALMKKFPAGYRFEPKDNELIKHYLYPKVNKLPLPSNSIKVVNIYSYSPWELSARYKPYENNEYYFFTPRERKYPNGKRPNRAASGGYWKASGIDGPIIDPDTNKTIGYKRSLVFYRGRPPKQNANKAEYLRNNKSDWLMHEYTLEKLKEQEKDKRPFTKADIPNHKQLNEFILCKIYMKRGKSTEVKVVDVAPPPPIGNATSSSAAVLEDRQQLHRTAVAAAAAVVGVHQYPRVATIAAEGMMSEYRPYMCQTDDGALGNHQNSLTSMVQEEIMPFNYNCNYLENGNICFSSIPSSAILLSVNHHAYDQMNQQQLQLAHHHYNVEMNQQQWQPAILPSVNHHIYSEMNQHQLQLAVLPTHNYNGEMNQHQLQPAVLPSVNHNYNVEVNQQQLDADTFYKMFVADLENIGCPT